MSPKPSTASMPEPLGAPAPPGRAARRERATRETTVTVALDLDRPGTPSVETGLPFFDHMLEQLGKHAGLSLSLAAEGDLEVDAHHTVEDVGIALGECLAEALGERRGIRRFSSLALPLDESLVEVALDISGRPYLHYAIYFPPGHLPLGQPAFDPQLAEEFWRAFATGARLTLHLGARYGRNAHHLLEASFKAVARALSEACRVEGEDVPSTKGVL